VALWIGAVLALAVGILATFVGLDRDRGFYPTVTIVIASYYVLFAVMGGMDALMTESLVGAVFLALAIGGFRSSLWLVVGALAIHGLFDFLRGGVISNPAVPTWWPQFCLAYDVTAAGYLAWLLMSGRIRAAS
jgi:hypothetical protein